MYSIISPIIRIIIKIILDQIVIILNFLYIKINGISKVISTSKIKKINPTRKNWILIGIRLDDSGSKPHSKGDNFSRYDKFFDLILLIITIAVGMIKTIKIIIRMFIIIYISWLTKFFNWKLNVIIYTI